MKGDLIKLLGLVWMCATVYMLYMIYIDIAYIADLVSAYMQMLVQNIRK